MFDEILNCFRCWLALLDNFNSDNRLIMNLSRIAALVATKVVMVPVVVVVAPVVAAVVVAVK